MALINGTENDDTLLGTGDKDTIYGFGGDDSIGGGAKGDDLFGGAGNDSLRGGQGGDELYGEDGEDYLSGGTENDKLYGGTGFDRLVGGDGNDILDGGEGGDRMTGGTGDDIYVVDSLDDELIEEIAGGIDRVHAAVDWVLVEPFEHLTLLGTLDIDGTGNAGWNEIIGNAGNNRLDGGDGNDFLTGGAGNDVLIGGNGIDVLTGEDAGDTLIGGAGDDIYYASDAVIIEAVDGGIDELNTNFSANLADNVENLDFWSYSAEAFILNGNAGNNRMTLEGDNETFISAYGHGGNDTIEGFVQGTYYFDGGTGDDLLVGYSGEGNTLIGGAGNDTLRLWDNARGHLEGGEGDDTYETYSRWAPTIVEEVAGGIDTVFLMRPLSSASWTLPDNVENLVVSSGSSTTFTGNESANRMDIVGGVVAVNGAGGNDVLNASLGHAITLNGGAGDDSLIGCAGDNTLDGGSGVDTMEGGAGSDRYYVDDINDVVKDSSTSAFDRDVVYASLNYTIGNDIEDLYLSPGTALNLSGTGNNFNNSLYGNDGDNTLNGLLGNDSLRGGLGQDTLYGGGNDDTLYGGQGNDALNGGGGDDFLYGEEGSDTLLGGAGNDYLQGGSSGAGDQDVLRGGDGNDVLRSGSGTTTMYGGAGNDTYNIGAFGTVVLNEAANEGVDTVLMFGSYFDAWTLGANLENLTIEMGSSDSFIGTGNKLDNVISARSDFFFSQSDVTLYGLDGNDTLETANMVATMSGGAGADAFLFGQYSYLDGASSITDFEGNADTLKLDYHIFGTAGPGALGAASFHAGTAATTADHRLIYDANAGALYYDADGNGAGAQWLLLNINVVSGAFDHADIQLYDDTYAQW